MWTATIVGYTQSYNDREKRMYTAPSVCDSHLFEFQFAIAMKIATVLRIICDSEYLHVTRMSNISSCIRVCGKVQTLLPLTHVYRLYLLSSAHLFMQIAHYDLIFNNNSMKNDSHF